MHVRIRRTLATTAAGVLLAVGSMGTAYADLVSNTVDSTIDPAAESMTLTAGGSSGTTTIFVSPSQGDGESGCNLKNDGELTVSAASSVPSVATVSMAGNLIADCGVTFGRTLTVHPVGAGTTTITVSGTPGTATSGSFNYAPATFTVTVSAPVPTNTPPVVGVTGFADGDDFELGVDTLPTPGCSVQDAEDSGESAVPTTTSVLDAHGTGTTTVTCTYSDRGGLTRTASASYDVVDTLAPTIVLSSVLPGANAAGWNRTPVTATWACSDLGTGVESASVSDTTVGEGRALSLTGTCTDAAGRSTSDTVSGIKVDLTAPEITIGRSPAPNEAGWNDGDVTVAWTCTDDLSGVVDAGGSTVLGEGEDQLAGGTCADVAGNTASGEVRDVDVDTTPPVIALASRTAAYDGHGWNDGDVTVTWTCSDTGSGPVHPTVSDVVSTPGADQTARATCEDVAGNTASATEGGINIDATSPSIEIVRSPEAANEHGWNDSPVEVSWTCTDTGGAGVVDERGSRVVHEGRDQSVEGTCTDHAGNVAEGVINGINVDVTKPTIQISRDPESGNADGWNSDDVTVTWTCADALSGATGQDGSTTLGEGANQAVEASCTDRAGNRVTGSITDIDIDKTAPEITLERDPAANAAGWSNTDVTVTWTCTDTLSGAPGQDGSTTLVEGANQTVEASCTDKAGNRVTDSITDIDIDKTAPVISISRSPAANAAGWNTGDVTVAWECTDALSTATDAGGSTVLGEGAGQAASGTCTDLAGNSATDEVPDVNVDKTAPSLSWVEPIGDGAQYYFGSVPPVPGCAATDTLSGIAGSCTVSGYGTGVGPHTLTARVADVAGNVSVRTSTYTVKAWTLTGFYKPVDMNGVWNTVKNGSTVPLKFEAFIGATELTTTAATGASFTVRGVTCPDGSATMDEVELTTTGGTSFRYDATAGQFVQNWQTPKKAGACYEVGTTLADGSSITARFLLK